MSTCEQLAEDLIAIPSISPEDGKQPPVSPHGEAALVDYLQHLLADWGAEVEVRQIRPDRPNLLARFDSGVPGPCLLLEAHSDTVAVDGMTIPPFTPEIRDGRLYGRGACDTKGPMAAMLVAIREILDGPGLARGALWFAAACGEELGGIGAKALAPELDPKPDAVVIAEPTDFNVIHRHKGVLRYRITTHGHACHSSTPERGINAIGKMQRVLEMLETYRREVLTTLSDPDLGTPTISVGTIHGGAQVNTVPDTCAIHVDHRLLPAQTPRRAAQDIQQLLKQFDVDDPAHPTDMETTQAYPPIGLPDDHPLVQTVLAAAQACSPTAKPAVARYSTDGGFFEAEGIPAVVVGPGSIQQAHTVDEFIELEALNKGVALYRKIIENFFSQQSHAID